MSTAVPFTPQLLGQTEKALNAILDRLLADSGLSEPEWVTLSIAVASDEPLDRGQLTSRVAGVLKVADGEAYALITALAERGLLELGADDAVVTEEGRCFRRSIAVKTGEITERLWGDLPIEDLDAAARVLTIVLSRVEGELALH
jgi:hypothetical protein